MQFSRVSCYFLPSGSPNNSLSTPFSNTPLLNVTDSCKTTRNILHILIVTYLHRRQENEIFLTKRWQTFLECNQPLIYWFRNIWKLSHFRKILPAFWWQGMNIYLFFSAFTFIIIRLSLLASNRASTVLFVILYFLLKSHHQHSPEVDVSHFSPVLPGFRGPLLMVYSKAELKSNFDKASLLSDHCY